jgi:hypothetical protein
MYSFASLLISFLSPVGLFPKFLQQSKPPVSPLPRPFLFSLCQHLLPSEPPGSCLPSFFPLDIGCPRNNQFLFLVRTETNRNSICFSCFSVCFAKQTNFSSQNKQILVRETNKFYFGLWLFRVSDQYRNNKKQT